MATIRIALANTCIPLNRQESLEIVLETMKNASRGAAALICFPECFLPGYRIGTTEIPDQAWLNGAWSIIDALAAELRISVILGTERVDKDRPLITARVTNSDETVRWAVRNGAHAVFHPHLDVVENDQYIPAQFADPTNTFHEKAALCRAAENTCYFATVNCAIRGSSTTSALVDPQGVLVAHQQSLRGSAIGCRLASATRTPLRWFRILGNAGIMMICCAIVTVKRKCIICRINKTMSK